MNMATHIIINPRKREVSASTAAPGDGTIFFSVDLINDSWRDYEYLVQSATINERKGEHRIRNRYLRAALANLYAHAARSRAQDGVFHICGCSSPGA